MIRYHAVVKNAFLETYSLEDASWINLSPPFLPGELDEFSVMLGIESDFLTDPLDIEERARYEKYDEARSIIFNTPVINETEKENDPIFITVPMGIVLCQGKIITICSVDSPVIDKFLDNKIKNFNPANETLFILHIFEQTVRLFLEYLKKLNMRRNLIEQELYNSSRSEELRSLLRIEKSLVYFVNSLSANELLKLKMKRTDFINIRGNEEYSELFEDIIVDNNQAREVAQLYTNILNGTMEAYASIISNNLNKFINRLTVITVILMVPTLIASFFGMNVPMPFNFSDSKASFYLVIIFALGFSMLLLWFFKRKEVL
ncbi:MAG: magnesium transporter CorA family protein [Saprospiraceae bacterium]|nr:magnesium transporter CorA family protein [Saprospiraceae bacterium]MBK8484195.1 magnesium transporter CorA family protein [Saprospiraceae bacterium]MBK9221597.1 magnesium transporter CorA family protein [Saprospiraceae bacterium]MBK9721465.1 magnesium transporter CorA family protein [Saprospiraceae bacterium]MBK9728530.1 magnesium transporter CorA family protein [Saprospiraceae bacterium]